MEEDKVACVQLQTDLKVLNVNYGTGSTAEDLCIMVCKEIGIGPIARHLFAFRNFKRKYWYPPNHLLDGTEDKLEFRLRFKPYNMDRLKEVDYKAYDYFFQQVRIDVLENNVPEIIYEKYKSQLLGLGVCDMYRIMLEENVSRECVLSDYKKFVPKECIKKHSFFLKKPIQKALSQLSGHDAAYVKDQYMKQFESMAPNYPTEDYKASLKQSEEIRILLRIQADKIEYCVMDNEMITLCNIEDLVCVAINPDYTVEISRKSGIPLFLKFSSSKLLLSFVSALDGYYRFSISWAFNLCKEVTTPSLTRLLKIRCHGPVGGEFSYAKLKEKRGNHPGTYILRESETQYNIFYLDVCGKDGKPSTHSIEQLGPTSFIFSSEPVQFFTSLNHLIKSHQDPEGKLYLKEYLPPSETDKSQILLCAKKVVLDAAADEKLTSELLSRRPVVILNSELQIDKSQPLSRIKEFSDDDLRSGKINSTVVHKAVWLIEKGKKVKVAIKFLKDESLWKEFTQMTSYWSQLKYEEFVRAFGLTHHPVLGMVMEVVNLGPLDRYLREKKNQVRMIDLIEAACTIATAVLRLAEEGIVHGNLRCHKILVHEHSEKSLTVKLTDPGIIRYNSSDIHWLPIECYKKPDSAKKSMEADVWALGTVLWEIFSRGKVFPTNRSSDSFKMFYLSGRRLPMPKGCSSEIYKVMLDSWEADKYSRKKAQEILRDLRHINLNVYNSRKKHFYSSFLPGIFKTSNQSNANTSEATSNDSSDCESRATSFFTDNTSLHWNDSEQETGYIAEDPFAVMDDSTAFMDLLLQNETDQSSIYEYSENNVFLGQMQEFFELTADCNVILQGRIGQGFYGEVYLGTLDKENSKDVELQQVAVKKIKMHAAETDIRDFEREISIMKTLKHPNVVEILGVIFEPDACLVMEYLKHGSLESYLSINREILNHAKLLKFALDIATGMDYLRSKSIVHRDLATRNILVADRDTVKISDFGLAQFIGKNDYYILQTNRDLPIKWYAPESLRDGKFSTKSDVWSFGVTMFEMFSFGKDPKLPGKGDDKDKGGGERNESTEEEGSTGLLAALERGIRLPCPSKCPPEIYERLMISCWSWDSHRRPSFAVLRNVIRNLMTHY